MPNFESSFLFSLKFPVNFEYNYVWTNSLPNYLQKNKFLPSPAIAHPEYVNIAVVVEIRLHGLVV